MSSLADRSCKVLLNVHTSSSLSVLNQVIIDVQRPYFNGGTSPYLVTFKDGQRGLFKPESYSNRQRVIDQKDEFQASKMEVAAYKFSELIGLNMVPETIIRTIDINGVSLVGSLQLFIDVPDALSFSLRLPARRKDKFLMRAFDFLIKNHDRAYRRDNYLVDRLGRIYLIDHGIAFGQSIKHEPLSNKTIKFFKTNKEAETFKENLKGISLEFLTKEIPELSEEQVVSLFRRIEFFLKSITD